MKTTRSGSFVKTTRSGSFVQTTHSGRFVKTTQRGSFDKNGSPPLLIFVYSLCAGLCLMCLALLLHPMSPEDFLLLSLTSPQSTWRHAYGIQAVILFWMSAVPTAIGLAGLLHRAARMVRRMMTALRHATGGAVLRERWSF